VQTYRDLVVWQRSVELSVEVYRVTATFPEVEKYGLVSQMRRAAVSIPSNIAEGKLRGSEKELHHFIRIAFGSGGELETQIEIAKRLTLLTDANSTTLDALLEEIMKMLNTMLKLKA
jgi:four helix bundle protein